jgi:hypothetical protein
MKYGHLGSFLAKSNTQRGSVEIEASLAISTALAARRERDRANQEAQASQQVIESVPRIGSQRSQREFGDGARNS